MINFYSIKFLFHIEYNFEYKSLHTSVLNGFQNMRKYVNRENTLL